MTDRNSTHLMTSQGLLDIKEELRQLKEKERPQLIKEVNDLRSLGDLKENEAYHQARKRQAMIDGRIIELEQIIKSAVISNKDDSSVIQLGSRVRVVVEGQEEEYLLVGENEANLLQGKISIASPLGKKLLGKRIKDTLAVQAPAGEIMYQILEIC